MEVPVTRIASFNLLVVSSGPEDPELNSVLMGLQKTHPARVIWTRIEPGRAWEESTGRLHLGCRCDGEQVCSEQIQICCGDQPKRVASLVLPLIRAGLPTHLIWWKAGAIGGPLFERLADRSKLILVESENWDQFRPQLPHLWSDPNRCEHAFYPLSWFRLLQSRQSIARAYGQANTRLDLTERRQEESELLNLWLEALLGKELPGMRIQFTSQEGSTLNWLGRLESLTPQDSLDAVRQALDKPHRDHVFKKIVETIKGA